MQKCKGGLKHCRLNNNAYFISFKQIAKYVTYSEHQVEVYLVGGA